MGSGATNFRAVLALVNLAVEGKGHRVYLRHVRLS